MNQQIVPIISGNQGFTLMTTLIGFSLLSLLMLGTVQMSEFGMKSSNQIRDKMDADNSAREITALLADPQTCLQNFSGWKDYQDLKLTSLKTKDGDSIYEINRPIVGTKLTTGIFNLHNFKLYDKENLKGRGQLQITLAKKSVLNKYGKFKKKIKTEGLPSFSRLVNIDFKLIELDRPKRTVLAWCAATGGLSDTFWKQAENSSDIYFPARVGIGTKDPNSEFSVNGNISFTGSISGGIRTRKDGRHDPLKAVAPRDIGVGSIDLQTFRTKPFQTARGDNSVIAGGTENINDSYTSVISGGEKNVIYKNSEFSSIGGGQKNMIFRNAESATISGGKNNIIMAPYSTIIGGQDNFVQSKTAKNSSIIGGKDNIALGEYSLSTGIGNQTTTYGQTIVGHYAQKHPGSASGPTLENVVFAVGAGTKAAPKSVFYVKSDGTAVLNDEVVATLDVIKPIVLALEKLATENQALQEELNKLKQIIKEKESKKVDFSGS